MYNPMEKILTNEGIGSNSYRDVWFLFDQVIISKGLLGNDFSSYKFYKAGVFNKPYLTQKEGKYKGQYQEFFHILNSLKCLLLEF